MEKIAWIIDSTVGYIDPEWIKENHVFFTPMQIVFEDKTYTEGQDITSSDFFVKLKNSHVSPTTSQPSIGSIVSLFEKLKEEGFDKGIAIHISSALSGTFSTTMTASQMVDFPIEAIDTKITAFPMRELLYEGVKLQKEGKNTEEISNYLREMVQGANAYLVVGDLNQLHKGGRMNGAQFLIGNLLQVKPIITFVDGKLVPKEKVRTAKKAKGRMIELFSTMVSENNGKKIAASIVHTASLEEAKEMKKELEEMFPDISFSIEELSATIGVHTGAGTLGVIWIKK